MNSGMQTLFFDIDDTLYNQLEPYERAFEAVFGEKIRLDVSDLFRRSRKHSDISYQLLLEGKISSERMFIYRIQKALEELENGELGTVLRAKGIVQTEDDSWMEFDMVPEESEIRSCQPDYTGRICVIGTELKTEELEKVFGK